MNDRYDWAGGSEAILRFGSADAPVVIVALPLFEEANRTRTFAVTVLRALAARGIAGVLPDLPGTNDSLVATQDMRLADLRSAFAAAAEAMGARYSFAIRSGALIDTEATFTGRWHLAPQSGGALVRELERIRQGAEDIAGNRVSEALLDALATATPTGDARIGRLSSDAQSAYRKFDAAPLWRRAEPDNDILLAQDVADDIAYWIASCEG